MTGRLEQASGQRALGDGQTHHGARLMHQTPGMILQLPGPDRRQGKGRSQPLMTLVQGPQHGGQPGGLVLRLQKPVDPRQQQCGLFVFPVVSQDGQQPDTWRQRPDRPGGTAIGGQVGHEQDDTGRAHICSTGSGSGTASGTGNDSGSGTVSGAVSGSDSAEQPLAQCLHIPVPAHGPARVLKVAQNIVLGACQHVHIGHTGITVARSPFH